MVMYRQFPQAIDIIKKKYELEMGKVRDRLPINLGVIYAGSKMPVRSLLEAGKVILSKPLLSPEVWKVENSNFEHNNLLVLNLEKQDRSLSWKIPLKMSDRVTDDNWYPYLFLAQDERQQSEKKGNITAPLPLGNGKTIKCPIFHARNLKKGDQVYLWPSTFDFEYLDTNARRFEVYYNRKGQRHRRTRPFYLEY